jgi:dihydroorotase
MGPNDKFDLVIKGGTVLDPSQRLNAKRDVGCASASSRRSDADIPAARAQRVLEASGRTVLPGASSDLHSHVFPYGSPIGIPADELVPYQGNAQPRSRAGDAGGGTTSPSFRRYNRCPDAHARCMRSST